MNIQVAGGATLFAPRAVKAGQACDAETHYKLEVKVEKANFSVVETGALDELVARTGVMLLTNIVSIIPDNYDAVRTPEEAVYAGPAETVKKLFNSGGVKTEFIELKNNSWASDKRGADWFGPALFISSLMITENPNAVSVALNILSNYLSTAFGIGGSPGSNARFKILVKNESSGVTKEISYDGPIDGIKELNKVVKSAAALEE